MLLTDYIQRQQDMRVEYLESSASGLPQYLDSIKTLSRTLVQAQKSPNQSCLTLTKSVFTPFEICFQSRHERRKNKAQKSPK